MSIASSHWTNNFLLPFVKVKLTQSDSPTKNPCLPHQLASLSHVLTECHEDRRFETEIYGVVLLLKTADILNG